MACSPPGTELPVNKREFCEIFKFSQQAQRENLLSTGHLYGLYTTQWPLSAIRFGNECPTHRLGSVRSAFQPLGEIPEIVLQGLAVAAPRLAINSRCGVPLETGVGLAESVWVIHVVQERRELQLPISYCCLAYPLERMLHAGPALSPEHGLLSRVPLGQALSLHPLRRQRFRRAPNRRWPLGCIRRFRLRARVGITIVRRGRSAALVRGLRRYREPVRLPTLVRHRRTSLDFPMRPVPPSATGDRGISRLPHMVHSRMLRVSDRAEPNGSLPWRHRRCGLPRSFTGSALRSEFLSRLNTWPTQTPVNASRLRLPAAAHDSEPLWVASPSTFRAFTNNTMPALTGAQRKQTWFMRPREAARFPQRGLPHLTVAQLPHRRRHPSAARTSAPCR
jgi:hypothetical protein